MYPSQIFLQVREFKIFNNNKIPRHSSASWTMKAWNSRSLSTPRRTITATRDCCRSSRQALQERTRDWRPLPALLASEELVGSVVDQDQHLFPAIRPADHQPPTNVWDYAGYQTGRSLRKVNIFGDGGFDRLCPSAFDFQRFSNSRRGSRFLELDHFWRWLATFTLSATLLFGEPPSWMRDWGLMILMDVPLKTSCSLEIWTWSWVLTFLKRLVLLMVDTAGTLNSLHSV